MHFNKTAYLTLITLGFLSCGVIKEAISLPTPKDAVAVKFFDMGSGQAEINIRVQDLHIEKIEQNGIWCDSIFISDEPTIGQAGYPDLPFIARTILLPPKSGVRIEVNDLCSQILHNIKPQIAAKEQPDGTFENVEACTQFQCQRGFWPPEPVTITEPAILRGHRLATIRFYPVQYNPSTGETRLNDEVNIKVYFEGDPINPILDERPKSSIYVHRILQGLVLNPPPPPSRDDVQCGSYLYVIPDVQGIDAEINPLIEWRRRQGHRVSIARVPNNTAAVNVHQVIRAAYYSDDPVEFVALVGEATAGASVLVPAATQVADYQYTCVEGDDPLPDIALGRISCTTLLQLRTIVNKILPYESNPNMQETNWYLQGAVVAGHRGNGLGEVLTAIYVRRELLNLGFREVRSWLWPQDGEIGQGDVRQPFISQCFEWGVSCFHYRAFNRMNNLPTDVIPNLRNRNGIYPAVLVISCNTGTFVAEESYTEAFLKSQGGGIGAIGTATGETNVRFNNLMSGGVWKGIYLKQLYCMGWGLNYGKYELWRAYHGLDEVYMNFMEWNNLIGDPGTHIWSAVPRRINVVHPQSLSLGGSCVMVSVTDRQTGHPEPNAQVCLWKADQLHSVLLTDDEGQTNFYISPDALNAGILKITVTKHNVQPYLGDIQVGPQAVYLGVSEWAIDDNDEGDSEGDGDGIANPGETVEVRCVLRNFGQQQPQGAITISGVSLSDWGEVIGEPVVIQQAPAAGQQTEFTIPVHINPSCPDQTVLLIRINVASGQTVWTSALRITVDAPKISITELRFDGGSFTAGDVKNLDIIVCNVGHKRLAPFTAHLVSLHPQIEILIPEISYEGINIRVNRGALYDRFRLRAHPMLVPGSSASLQLITTSINGFRDTAYTTITLGQVGNNDPLGPDRYGYLCFDSGDQGWDQTPTYNWIEINPTVNPRQFNGTPLNLTDATDNDDTSRVVNLPFNFQYYGQRYDRITICTNGWLAFGDAVEFSDFRNQHIGQALGPRAMLAVWWDNLITVDGSSILTYYDQNGGRFIVEWYRLRRLLDGGIGAWETFEVVLYNPQVHQTPTGDGVILFQYREVTNENARAHNDIPYCTIGIQSPSGDDGIEYTYWNQYPRGARPIASQMALKFTTSNAYRMGCIAGRVTDAVTGEPIEGAEIVVGPGYFGKTNRDGNYIISDVRVGQNYNIKAQAVGWNDSTRAGLNVSEAETTYVNFALLHPTFEITPEEVEVMLEADNMRQVRFRLQNRGNGTLNWNVERRLPPNTDFTPWEIRGTLPIARILNDDRIESAVFVNDRFYVAGANVVDSTLVYILDREGNRIGTFRQFGAARYGMKDMDYDGELIWGSGEAVIFGFTPEGELRRTIQARRNPMAGIAWDPDRNLLWACPNTNDLDGYDLNGNLVRTIPRGALRIYGLAYWTEDPDNKKLYIFCYDSNIERQQLYRVNPDDRQIQFVTYLDPPEGGRSGGAFISNQWDVYNWTLITTTNNSPDAGGDRIYIYELAPRRDWMRITPEAGTLAPNEEQVITLTLDATDLPETEFQGELLFRHNASGGKTIVPITLSVRGAVDAPDIRLLSFSQGWNLISLNILPLDSNIVTLTQPLVDAGLLRIVKDNQGRFYSPLQRFNNIPYWANGQAYWFNLTEMTDLIVAGYLIPVDTPIRLTAGWNTIAYLPRVTLPVQTAVASIIQQLIIVKDCRGRFYLPEFDFTNLDFMREGEGYQIKVTEDTQLIYDLGNDQDIYSTSISSVAPRHFICPIAAGDNLSLLAIGDASMSGWELGAINEEGEILGGGVFDKVGKCGIAIWGKDAFSDHQNSGFDEGERINLVLWDGEKEYPPELVIITGELNWTKDGLVVGRVNPNSQVPISFGFKSVYPNPFNRVVQVHYGLEKDGEIKIVLYDLAGREIKSLNFNGRVGYHTLNLNASDLTSGIYLLKLKQHNKSAVVKITLIK